jgi:hypothetical protein
MDEYLVWEHATYLELALYKQRFILPSHLTILLLPLRQNATFSGVKTMGECNLRQKPTNQQLFT